MKLWQKKYKLNELVEKFTVGNDYVLDCKLVKHDCRASIAHARMLEKIGVLSKEEREALERALEEIIELDARGKFEIRVEDEDCHTAIENYLVEKIGNVGKKIHTARSRNDQVLAALRLYYREEGKRTLELIGELQKALALLKKKSGKTELPGYTHMRKAMPSSIEMWSSVFEQSMEDNKELLKCALKLLDQSPLGSGAGYGLPIDVDREMTAKLLGFSRVQKSPIYVQNGRGKLEATLIHALAQIMLDLNRMASDLILFSMPEFGFFELPEEICTGSSIMPQKRNPDVLELIRAKYHAVNACEFEVRGITANLISGYHRDLQLTKEPVMRALGIAEDSLEVVALVLEKLKVNEENCKRAMTRELFATKKAYELVKKGVEFREAYRRVAKEF
ncbi:MAG: argininosuccinate lyase [Candidatus Micrarchaeota archaeon]